MALDKYKSTDDTVYGELGPCLVSGHPKEHVLEVKCLSEMRRFLFPNKTFAQFMAAVNRKR
jgi:hypothetical protein